MHFSFSDPQLQHQIIYVFDLIGTMIFALTGAVRGVRAKLDLLGVLVFACTVGVGGGMLRDVVIGAVPVSALQDGTYLFLCILTGAVVFFTAPQLSRIRNLIQICDAFGLGFFTANGAAKGVDLGIVGVVFTGVITAVGGGVIRDVMSGRIPVVFTTDFYATASLLGGFFFCFLTCMNPDGFFLNFFLVMAFVTGLRMLAIRYHLRLPVSGGRTSHLFLHRRIRKKP